MKDMKFVIIILLMFFGLEIKAQINNYDYNVNNTGIMYQENDNIVLNENNRYYDYDIDFNLDESYLHYSPVKKGGLLDSLYNDKSKNLAIPDLTGKQYLGNGNYRIYNGNGIIINYNINFGYIYISGTVLSAFNYDFTNLFDALESPNILTYYYSHGTISNGNLSIFTAPYNVNNIMIITTLNYMNNNIKVLPIGLTRVRFQFETGQNFNSFQFQLQLEKGDIATSYEVPYIPALQIAFNGTNQVEYINPFVEQIIEINDINNVNNIDFELLNTKNPVVFNWNITTNPNIPFVRFYNNQTKLLYDFTDVKEMNSIGNTLIGSHSNILNGFDFALDLVNTFYEGFQKLFNTKLIENIRDALSRVWPLLPPKWPWAI